MKAYKTIAEKLIGEYDIDEKSVVYNDILFAAENFKGTSSAACKRTIKEFILQLINSYKKSPQTYSSAFPADKHGQVDTSKLPKMGSNNLMKLRDNLIKKYGTHIKNGEVESKFEDDVLQIAYTHYSDEHEYMKNTMFDPMSPEAIKSYLKEESLNAANSHTIDFNDAFIYFVTENNFMTIYGDFLIPIIDNINFRYHEGSMLTRYGMDMMMIVYNRYEKELSEYYKHNAS